MKEAQSFLDDRVRLLQGDSREMLKLLPDSSIDAVITDPPYALVSITKRFGKDGSAPPSSDGATGVYKRASAGFMGKQWDTGETAFAAEFWAEVLRVLKPGGHVVAFSGTRTYHRMACAIEDAGFEIRDQLAWCYGCLDDQTEAVTPRGLVRHSELNVGDLVLTYDADRKSYQWDAVEHVHRYQISDTVYRISTPYGDQVVSRNHRCIVERGGAETFEFAEEAARQREARVPVLEDLSALLEALRGSDKRTGNAQSDLLEGVQGRSDRSQGDRATVAAQSASDRTLFGLREGKDGSSGVAAQGGAAGLFATMQRRLARGRVESARAQRSGRLVRRDSGALSAKLHGLCQSILEGWRYLSAAQRQLCERALCPMPAGVPGNVPAGWLRDGASAGRGSHPGALPDARGVGASHRPQAAQQCTDEPHAVRDEQGSQAVRGWQGHRAVVGRITPEHYDGVIWCVTVRTGAFVAVRDGMAFPTGNSGFPKSQNVAKFVDKHLGVSGTARAAEGAAHAEMAAKGAARRGEKHEGWDRPWMDDPDAIARANATYEPASPEAKEVNGYGTALKPAWEPICLARKPLAGTVAANVLAHGTGALNVDGCRVEGEKTPAPVGEYRGSKVGATGLRGVRDGSSDHLGRWPANVIHDGSDEVLACFPEAPGQQRALLGGEASKAQIYGNYGPKLAHEPLGDAGSAARFFYTAKADADDRLGSKHPTVKPLDLMQWLVRLVCPKGGTVLDPFAGTGTTGEAAWREGMRAVLVEREPEYQADICRRMDLAAKPTKRAATAKGKGKLDDPSDLPLFGAKT